MNLSGIVVAVPPSRHEEAITALNAFDHIEVHQSDATSGQIVIVQEAETTQQEINSLKAIKALPMVTYAEMVYHYLAEEITQDNQDSEIGLFPPDDLDNHNLDKTLEKLNS